MADTVTVKWCVYEFRTRNAIAPCASYEDGFDLAIQHYRETGKTYYVGPIR